MILRLHGGVHLCYYCTYSMYLVILLHYLMIFHTKSLVAVTVFIPQDSIVTCQNYPYIIVICYAISFLRMLVFLFLLLAFHHISIYLTIFNVLCCNTTIPRHLWEIHPCFFPKIRGSNKLAPCLAILAGAGGTVQWSHSALFILLALFLVVHPPEVKNSERQKKKQTVLCR